MSDGASGEAPSPLLSAHTTMRVGGPASRFVVADTVDELVDAVRLVDDAGEPLGVFSGGSNLVVADEGVDATV
ncbi:UDP-N-acetylenolpyruvoylglucosamine reductase, partial [Mobilicoccus pelagius NBRC 104925]